MESFAFWEPFISCQKWPIWFSWSHSMAWIKNALRSLWDQLYHLSFWYCRGIHGSFLMTLLMLTAYVIPRHQLSHPHSNTDKEKITRRSSWTRQERWSFDAHSNSACSQSLGHSRRKSSYCRISSLSPQSRSHSHHQWEVRGCCESGARWYDRRCRCYDTCRGQYETILKETWLNLDCL